MTCEDFFKSCLLLEFIALHFNIYYARILHHATAKILFFLSFQFFKICLPELISQTSDENICQIELFLISIHVNLAAAIGIFFIVFYHLDFCLSDISLKILSYLLNFSGTVYIYTIKMSIIMNNVKCY